MKKKIILISCIFLFLFILNTMNLIYANTTSADSWIDQALRWKLNGSTNTYLDDSVLSDIATIVEVAGTAVIAIATVVVGIKYVLGSVTEQASAKENLITLLVACIFFFGWSSLRGILITGASFTDSGAVTNIEGNVGITILDESQGFEGMFSSVFGIVLTIAQIIALLATAYMGMKYIFSGAEGKAKLKQKGIMYLIGIILIFTTLNFIKFISSAINGMF